MHRDVHPLHAEVGRLRQLLAASHAEQTDAVHAIRQTLEKQFSEERSGLLEETGRLQGQLAALEHELTKRNENHEHELALWRTKLGETDKAFGSAMRQVETLKQELQNVATLAAAEQRELSDRHRSAVIRHESLVAEQLERIESLDSQMGEQEELLVAWELAHDGAVALCEWHDSQHHLDRKTTAEALAARDDQIARLHATIGILRTDHETVEIINGDLDHRNDDLQSQIDWLQHALESLEANANRERSESNQKVAVLREEAEVIGARLAVASEERKSLIESLAKRKSESESFDASLFAKDQEIEATRKVANDAQRQLEQLRREHDAVAVQNDQMRNQLRELSGKVTRLESELSDALRTLKDSEATTAVRERQLRDLQSAARAAEADSLLRASESEQQYVVRMQQLEDELERQRESELRITQANKDQRTKISELENELAHSKQSAAAAEIERSRLQEVADQLEERISRSEKVVADGQDQIAILDATVIELRSELSDHAEASTRMEREQEESRTQIIDSLKQDVEELISERDELVASAAESARRTHQLETKLGNLSVYENPVNEVKRLSAELARRVANHARERESLYRRIEHLRSSPSGMRAA
jgi:chromosome segregation ATPase